MTDQIKLLNALAKKIKSGPQTKKQSMERLVTAKILNKNGKMTAQYANLGKLVSKAS